MILWSQVLSLAFAGCDDDEGGDADGDGDADVDSDADGSGGLCAEPLSCTCVEGFACLVRCAFEATCEAACIAGTCQVRRDEQNRQNEDGKQLIKGSRYLLLKGQETLADDPDKQSRLDALLEANETLHKVYLLKQDLRQFSSKESKDDAD